MNYIPLWVKTNYTILSSLVSIKALVKKIKEDKFTSVAIADTNVLYGAMAFYHECLANDIKPIIGVELHIENNKILLYAQNYQGYQNLCRIVTLKNESDIKIDNLAKYSDNLVCLLPYDSIILYPQIRSLFKHFFLGYSSKEERDLLQNKNETLVFINEVLYIEAKDSKYLPYIYAIKDNKKVEEIKDYPREFNHLLAYNEALALSSEEDLKNTNIIGKLCDISFPLTKLLLPKYDINIDEEAYLRELCKKGLNKRLNNKVPERYSKRLNYELDMINKMGYANYFLIVWDFICYAKKHNILVGPGRGSSASSLVSYTLGITAVDPLVYDLLFERFLNPERITLPDIDIDFPDRYRDQIIAYVAKRYGSKHVAQIITFGTFGVKQALRDGGKVLAIPNKIIDQLIGLIPYGVNHIQEAYQQDSKVNKIINSLPSLKKLLEVVTIIEGMPRHSSIHAAGIVICQEELDNLVPLIKNQTGIYVIGYTMEYLEELGLLKMDFLGLKNLTIIMDIIKSIETTQHKAIAFNNIRLDDKKTLTLFTNVDTEGIFQFESRGMKHFLSKLKITSFAEIVLATALFRPGPMANIDSYIKRKFNKEKIDYIHPDLDNILRPTYGIIVYQEQILQIVALMAGYSLGEADVLRRAMSKKQTLVLVNEKEKFIRRSMAKGYELKIASRVYDLILKFANYGFPKAHAVAYALIAYRMAYLKANYLNHFIATFLNNVIGSEVGLKKYIYEAKIKKVAILKPDINLSNYLFKVSDDGIRYGLAGINHLNSIVGEAIIEERKKGKYRDFIDFICRNFNKVNVPIIEQLIYSGCFSSFGYNKKTLLSNLDKVMNYAELSEDIGMLTIEKPQIEIVAEFSKEELRSHDLTCFGFYLTAHPATKYKLNKQFVDLININNYFNQFVHIIGCIEQIKVIKTKKNEEMAFFTVSDELAKIDLILFPKVYQAYKDYKSGNVIKVSGKVERRLALFQIIVQQIEFLE